MVLEASELVIRVIVIVKEEEKYFFVGSILIKGDPTVAACNFGGDVTGGGPRTQDLS